MSRLGVKDHNLLRGGPSGRAARSPRPVDVARTQGWGLIGAHSLVPHLADVATRPASAART
eukprot:scaffold29642_cov46-Phaeocystis_antarctica.AAC.1